MGRINGIDWDELERIEDSCQGWRAVVNDPIDGCASLPQLSQVYVPGEGGDPEAFIIGEAPGAQEEMQRRPFVGPAGIAMRDLMAIAELYTAYTPKGGAPNCWLTNVVKFRPTMAGRRNRTPNPLEIRASRPWLRAEWVAVGKPIVIVPVGGIALSAITGKQQSILVAAGKLHKARSRDGIDLCIWPMVHPSFGIRTPAARPLLEQDWERFAEWMKKARRHGWVKP